VYNAEPFPAAILYLSDLFAQRHHLRAGAGWLANSARDAAVHHIEQTTRLNALDAAPMDSVKFKNVRVYLEVIRASNELENREGRIVVCFANIVLATKQAISLRRLITITLPRSLCSIALLRRSRRVESSIDEAAPAEP